MAKRREPSTSSVTAVAEIVGRATGQAPAAVEAFRSRHPHPIAEVGEAISTSQEALADLTAQAPLGSAAVVAKTREVAHRGQEVVRRARRRAVKTLARAKRTTKKAMTRTKDVARKPLKAANTRGRTAPTPTGIKTAASRKKRRTKRPSPTTSGSAGQDSAKSRSLQTAHVKRRQAHTAARGKRQQARRDKRR
jgi:hypothetical protein